MPNVRLELTLPSGRPLPPTPLAVEVIGEDLERKWRGAIVVGKPALVKDLQPGRYSIEANLPSGRKVGKNFRVGEEAETNVVLRIPENQAVEGLEWACLIRDSPLTRSGSDEERFRSTWLRLWGNRGGGRWTVRPWPTQVAIRTAGAVQYQFRLRRRTSYRQHFLQIGGPGMQWRLVALPADDVHVLIASIAPESEDVADARVEVSVESQNHAGDTLLRYLSRGDIAGAEATTELVLAEELVESRDATAATAAGYFLLSTRNLDRLQQVWISSLADKATWLPDTSIIDAWASLRQPTPDLTRARRRLLEAAARGLPVYTPGLRLLLDGLAMFDDDVEYTGPDVRAALRRVRRFAAHADWRAANTTFIGRDPTTPGRTRRARPNDLKHLVYVDSVEHAHWNVTEEFEQAEIGEEPDPVHLSADRFSKGFSDQQEVDSQAAKAVASVEARVRISSLETKASSPQGLVARLFRAADSQTETDRLAPALPVPLDLDIEHPVSLYGVALERVIGLTTFLSVNFLERGVSAARSVARLVRRNARHRTIGYGTGFLVSPHLLVTCNHLLPTATDAQHALADFDYQDGLDGRLVEPYTVKLDPRVFFVTDFELDVTVVAVEGGPVVGERFGWLRLGEQEGWAIAGEYVSAIQHLDGAPKQITLRENRITRIEDRFIHYTSPTAPPSAGAPLFNDQWEVVGMHHAGIAERDVAGRFMAVNGSVWTPDLGLQRLRWASHEGICAFSIMALLRDLDLPEPQAAVRDELVYSEAHARSAADAPDPFRLVLESSSELEDVRSPFPLTSGPVLSEPLSGGSEVH
jgi:V8-like Glu-specific endopeptidase